MARLFTFSDNSYIPLSNPLSRRYDMQSKPSIATTTAPAPEQKKKKPLRYEDWSQRDKMEYTLNKLRQKGSYSMDQSNMPKK